MGDYNPYSQVQFEYNKSTKRKGRQAVKKSVRQYEPTHAETIAAMTGASTSSAEIPYNPPDADADTTYVQVEDIRPSYHSATSVSSISFVELVL